jgi:hypothetical protein
MTAHLPGPLPCPTCDTFVNGCAATDRVLWSGVRWWLDDRETAAGRPHMHVTQVRAADLNDYRAALDRECADVEAVARLGHDLAGLAWSTLIVNDGEELWRQGEARLYREGDIVTPAALTALLAEMYQREQAKTWYLGGSPSIVRLADGEYGFIFRRPARGAEEQEP